MTWQLTASILCAGKFSIPNFQSPFLYSVSLCPCRWRCALQQSLRKFGCPPCPVCFAPFPGLSEGKNPNLSNSAPGGPDLVLGKTLWSLGRQVRGVTYPKLPLPPCSRASLPIQGDRGSPLHGLMGAAQIFGCLTCSCAKHSQQDSVEHRRRSGADLQGQDSRPQCANSPRVSGWLGVEAKR